MEGAGIVTRLGAPPRLVLAVQEDLQVGRERDPAELACSRIGAITRDQLAAIPARET
jgi:hypothetical protein